MVTSATRGTITARCAVCLRAACRVALEVVAGLLLGAGIVALLAALEVRLPW